MKRNIKIKERRAKASRTFSLSTSFDDGEILPQERTNSHSVEYVVQSSITDIPFEEYVIDKEDEPFESFKETPVAISDLMPSEPAPKAKEAPATDEEKLKLLDNIKPVSAAEPPKSAPVAQPAPEQKNEPQSKQSSFEYMEPNEGVSEASSADDDFAKDMAAILQGKKRFNEKTKTVEDNDDRSAAKQSAGKPPAADTPSLEQFTNQHSIFDEIAKSMEYAKAYDLGSISLAQKFEDFDRIDDMEKRLQEKKNSTPAVSQMSTAPIIPPIQKAEMLEDLSIISRMSKAKEAPVSESSYKAAANGKERYLYESQSLVMAQSYKDFSYAQNPAVIGGIAVADAIQIGLGAAAIVQAQVSATQGSFTLSYDKAQRMLTNEARMSMPGSQKTKQSYSRRLFWIGELKKGFSDATIIIEWEGNPYGEIGTAIIRRDLQNSTEWTKSSNNTTITKVDRIPLPGTDPRTWPLVYTYEGTFDPVGNGHFEYGGEFEINAFGGLKFIRHEVVDRSLVSWTKIGEPEDYVKKGDDVLVDVPDIPKEQIDYLRSRLP